MRIARYADTPEPARFSPSSVGILYAEDFDDPADLIDAVSRERSAVPPEPALTQADLDAACAQAVLVARAEWQASHERASLDAIASLTRAVTDLRETVERSTLDVAEGTVAGILSMVAGLLPHFSAEHGPAEVRALLARLLPTLRSQGRVSVRVQADLVATLQRDLTRLDAGTAAIIEVGSAALEPGDVKVSWENGTVTRDTRVLAEAVKDALGELGLNTTTEAPAKRRMAYAD